MIRKNSACRPAISNNFLTELSRQPIWSNKTLTRSHFPIFYLTWLKGRWKSHRSRWARLVWILPTEITARTSLFLSTDADDVQWVSLPLPYPCHKTPQSELSLISHPYYFLCFYACKIPDFLNLHRNYSPDLSNLPLCLLCFFVCFFFDSFTCRGNVRMKDTHTKPASTKNVSDDCWPGGA